MNMLVADASPVRSAVPWVSRRHGRSALVAALLLAGCAGHREARVAALPRAGQTFQAGGRTMQITGLTALPPPDGAASPPAAVAPPPGMQYLYGSGEAAAISLQAWRVLVGYVAGKVQARPADSVVLDEEATLAAPRFVPCGSKPFAAVFDVDETVLLNLGFESDEAAHPGRAYDDARWQAWERTGAARVAAVPGAKAALDALRTMGVTVVFNSNRSAANAALTVRALDAAGLGPAVHGRTLWLKGDDETGSLKDGRRRRIADSFCVLAMGGDQLGDFSDLFNAPGTTPARRAAVAADAVAGKWGAGWFVLPNPVYGTALKGGADDLFPAAARWTPDTLP